MPGNKNTRFSRSYPLPLMFKGQRQQQPCTAAAAPGAAARLDVAADAEYYNQPGYEISCLQIGKFCSEGPKYPRAEFVSALLLLRRRNSWGDEGGCGGYVRQCYSYCRIGLAVILESCDDDAGWWERREVEVV